MKIPKHVLDELVSARTRAQALSQAFSETIKAQAEKHKLKPAALRAYVCALADDKLNDLGQLADQLVSLIDDDQPDLFAEADSVVTALDKLVQEHKAAMSITNPETGEVIFASRVNE